VAKVEYKTFDVGTYEVAYLEFFTRDNDGLPIFVTQETKAGPMLLARYRTFDSNGEEMPPGSVQPEQLPLLVHAFGADPTQLPDDRLCALQVAEQLIKEADKTVRVFVAEWSKGWISKIQGMRLPVGSYLFQFSHVSSREGGKPAWQNGKYGENARIQLKVAFDGDGSPSLFTGCTETLWLNRQAFTVMRAIIPDVFNAMLGNEDEELAHLEEFASASKHYIWGEISEEGRESPRLVKETLRVVTSPMTSSPTSVSVAPAEINVEDEEKEPEFIQYLYDAISSGVAQTQPGVGAFTATGALSDAGRAWCREHLGPIAKEHGLTNKFSNMTKDTVEAYLKGLGREDLVAKMNGNQVEEDAPW